jgi:transcriptional regulator with XRE-family HTH domain
VELADDTGNVQTRQPAALTGGERLKYHRGQLRWTQSQLACRFQQIGAWYLGAPKWISSLVSMISKWEGDVIVPDSYNLHILAEALQVQVEELGFLVDPHYVHPPRRVTPLPIG